MKKQVTDRQKRELARRKAMPIALIQSPLKFIASKDVHLVTGKDGVIRRGLGGDCRWARLRANAGLGGMVQHVARQFL